MSCALPFHAMFGFKPAPEEEGSKGIQTYLAGHHATLSHSSVVHTCIGLLLYSDTKGEGRHEDEVSSQEGEGEDGILLWERWDSLYASNTCCNGTNCKGKGCE